MMRKKHFISLLLLFAPALLMAQLRTRPMDRLDWYNPWIGGANMAGLVEDSFLKGDRDDVSEACASLAYKSGVYRNVFDPEKAVDFDLGVESHLKLKDLFLYGRFGYGYEFDMGNTWRGSRHPYDAPFMLADEVKGDISDETYSMRAGFGLPLGKFSVGADVSYDVGIMAKQRDLRNRNTDMIFNIAPSVTYKAGAVRLGLDAGYTRATEKVEYTQIAANKENYLYYLRGLWLYSKYGYSSAETSRQNISNKADGNFTVDWNIGEDWRLFNCIGAHWRWLEQAETGYNNLRYGDVSEFGIEEKLRIQFKDVHRIDAGFSMMRQNGFRYLQQEQSDPRSGTRRYVNYGDPVRCHYGEQMDALLGYSFRKAFNVEASAGLRYSLQSRIFTEYPFSFTQKFSSLEPYASFSFFVTTGRTRWELNPSLSYRAMLTSVRNDVAVDGSMPYELLSDMQLEGPLNAEADFFGRNRYNASFALGCEFWRMFLKLRHDFFYVIESAESRHFVTLKVGIAF